MDQSKPRWVKNKIWRSHAGIGKHFLARRRFNADVRIIMQDLYIDASASSPEVDFRFSRHSLSLAGESYPENASAFYGRIIVALREYLSRRVQGDVVTVNIDLRYFNSSSTKMLFNLMDALNQACQMGVVVVLNWFHDVDDETIAEFGCELHADFPALQFHDHAVERR